MIAEKTLSNMVKGKRTSGTVLRRDLRAIVKVLYQKNALLTLEEANRLMTKIPAIKELDERDPDDAEIIALFDILVTEIERAAGQSNNNASSANALTSSDSQDDASASDTIPEPTVTPPPIPSPANAETTACTGRETKKRPWWYIGSFLVALMVILGTVLVITQSIFSRKTDTCPANMNGVTLYTDINYRGQCHTFRSGDYELAQFGLEQKVARSRTRTMLTTSRFLTKTRTFTT